MDNLSDEQADQALRATLGCFATGVAVVTTLTDTGQPCGLTINSFSSVSLNPPLILWSLSCDSANLKHFDQAEFFSINILNADQLSLCRHFANIESDRFKDIAWQKSSHGMPVLNDVTAVINCRTWRIDDGGDHRVYYGEILDHHHNQRPPLIFAKGQFTRLQEA